jgi:WD40 repeat protein
VGPKGDDIYLAIERGLEASRTLALCLSPTASGSGGVGLERSAAGRGNLLFRDPATAGSPLHPATAGRLQTLLQSQGDANLEVVMGKPTMSKRTREQLRRAQEEGQQELPPGVKLLRTLEWHKSAVTSVAFDPQGKTLASGSQDKTVKLWEAPGGKLIRTLKV